jgi:predicted alpha-1,2-mannosidase
MVKNEAEYTTTQRNAFRISLQPRDCFSVQVIYHAFIECFVNRLTTHQQMPLPRQTFCILVHFFFCAFLFLHSPLSAQPTPVTRYVNPFIGTGGHGHTYPGATVPFGMVQLSPDGDIDGWDWASGYHESDTTLMGFSHTHFSGTGIGDLGDVSLMPTTGKLNTIVDKKSSGIKGYRSKFSHEREKAEAGYYAVTLDDYGVQAELTATERAGFHKYTFPKTADAHIILNLRFGICWDWCTDSEIKIINDSTIVGTRRSSGWAQDQVVHFVAHFSKPFASFGIAVDTVNKLSLREAKGNNLRAFVNYATEAGEVVYVKVGISAVSVENAMKNVAAEIPHWSFNRTRQEAEAKWEKILSRIALDGSEKDKTIFYTALYHLCLAPVIYSDVNGEYRGMDKRTHTAKGFTNYTIFSLWDTFRAAHPFFTLATPEIVNDLVRSLLAAGEEFGSLPVWTFASNETYTMMGYHAVPVIVDAYNKGFRNFDTNLAFDLMKHGAMQFKRNLNHYRKYKYIPFDKDGSSASQTVEFAYDDWCISEFAKAIKKPADAKYFAERSTYFKNLFDASSASVRGKDSLGNWRAPFDRRGAAHGEGDFMEGNAWQYTWFYPQDVNGLIALMGGTERFLKNLNDFFADTTITGNKSADVTGLIGQYAHGNEPSHHVAYLFNYAGKPSRTEELVHQIKTTLYSDTRGGLCGNDDCGQLSAWYLFSALGFYPVNPANGIYDLGTPTFSKVALKLPNGKTFTVDARNLSEKNFYVKSVSLNGKPLKKRQITHQDIMRGGTLTFEMSGSLN